MNIAILSPYIYPCSRGGGVETFNYYFAKELASQGHTIWMFTCCDHDWSRENIHYVKIWKGAPGLTILSIYFSIILNLIKLRNKIDILHIPYTSNDILAFPGIFSKKLFGLPYIIMIHGGMTLEWKLKMLHQSFFKNAGAIIAASERMRAEYEKRSSRKMSVIPPLMPFVEAKIPKNELKNKYGFDEKDIVILYLGSIWYMKGSDVLLEAFISLGMEYIKSNNLKLLYVGEGITGDVGDGNMKDDLQRKTVENNFSQYVKFFGSVSHEKVPEMYKLADIYVKPSLLEGSPISLREAMFNGLPIIGSNVDGINNHLIHEKNGVLFEKGNSTDLKNKIIQLVDDSSLAHNLGACAKKDYSNQYIFQNMISDHIKLYKEVIDSYQRSN